MDLSTFQGTQEFRGTLPLWERGILRTPILGDFSPTSPSSKPCGAAVKPRRSQSFQSMCHSISRRSTGNLTEVEKEHPMSRSGSVERSHFFGPVNYMIFV